MQPAVNLSFIPNIDYKISLFMVLFDAYGDQFNLLDPPQSKDGKHGRG